MFAVPLNARTGEAVQAGAGDRAMRMPEADRRVHPALRLAGKRACGQLPERDMSLMCDKSRLRCAGCDRVRYIHGPGE